MSPLGTLGTNLPIVPAQYHGWWHENWQGEPKYSKKRTCPKCYFVYTNAISADLGSNLDGKQAINGLSYGMAQVSTTSRERELNKDVETHNRNHMFMLSTFI